MTLVHQQQRQQQRITSNAIAMPVIIIAAVFAITSWKLQN